MAAIRTSEEGRERSAKVKNHRGGRPRVAVASLADQGAEELLKRDIKTWTNPKASKADRKEAGSRLVAMCKGRVATKVELSGEDGQAIKVSIVEVVRGNSPG